MNVCAVEGCEGISCKRGYCNKHYEKLRLYGDPLFAKQTKTSSFPEALALKTKQDGECLVWTGALTAAGYGSYGGKEKAEFGTQYVHRLVWMLKYGQIPSGVKIDHMCWNRACCRIEHLRAVDQAANMQNISPGAPYRGKTGVKGVYLKNGKYIGQLSNKHKSVYVGSYATLAEAAEAVALKRKELYTPNPLKAV